MNQSQSLEVVQAFDRVPFAHVTTDDGESLEVKLDVANRALGNRGELLQRDARRDILQKAADLLEARGHRFSTLIAREGGKPMQDAEIEVLRAIDGLRIAAEQLGVMAGREIPMGLNRASEHRWAFTTNEPIGVVAAISAFNHPLNLIVHQVAPAVAVGCPVIVKPATATPLCCLQLVELLHEAGLAEHWCQTFVTADNGLAERLATDERVAFLSFVGSARVGWHLRGKLAAGTRCALEHGGAAPVIVDRSADLDRAIGPIVKGGYYHAGQVCVSVQRIFVHSSVKDDFLRKFSARVAALKVGDPQISSTEVGPLIHPRETVRVESWIAEAAASGAVVIGGGRVSETTLVPSILVEPPLDAKVSGWRFSARSLASMVSTISSERSRLPIRFPSHFKPVFSQNPLRPPCAPHAIWMRQRSSSMTIQPSEPTGCHSRVGGSQGAASAAFLGRCARCRGRR